MNKPVAGSEYREMGAWGQELKVSAQKDPNMTVTVNAGTFYTDGMRIVEYEGGTSPVIKKPSQYNEWVVICLNKQGTLYIAEGNPAPKPDLPVLEKHYLPLAAIYLTANSAKITSDMIFDIRPRFVSGTYAVDHANVENTHQENCHPISAITNLREILDAKASMLDLEKVDDKIDNVRGTNSATFVLNQAQTGVPFANVGITVKRGEEPNVGIRYNEHKGVWEFTNDGSVWNEMITAVSLDGSLKEATATAKGVVRLSVEPLDAYHPIAVGDNDPRIAAINDKADKVSVYTKTEVDDKIADKIDSQFTYSRRSIDEMLAGKMDINVIYTEAQIDAKLLGKANVGDSYLKADADVMLSNKADKEDTYAKAEVDNVLALKADMADVYTRAQTDLLLDDKADKANVYDRSQVDGMALLKADKADVYTQGEIDVALALKANADSVYTAVETDNLLLEKADKANVYNKADADTLFAMKEDTYGKAETDDLVAAKADANDVYTKLESDALLGAKADALDTYNKEQTDALLDLKADKADTYTKSEIANELRPYAKTDDVITRLGDYAKSETTYTKAEVNNKLADKANTTDINAALELKADKAQYYSSAVIDSKLANYTTVSDFNVLSTQAARVADIYTKADIDAKLADKGSKVELVNLVAGKADVEDLDAYVRLDELETKLTKYAFTSVVNTKANASDVYSIEDADDKFETKAHFATVIAGYAKTTDVVAPADLETQLANYALSSDLDAKATVSSVETVATSVSDLAGVVETKADKTELNNYVKKTDSVDSVVLESANGTQYRLVVQDDGTLTTIAI